MSGGMEKWLAGNAIGIPVLYPEFADRPELAQLIAMRHGNNSRSRSDGTRWGCPTQMRAWPETRRDTYCYERAVLFPLGDPELRRDYGLGLAATFTRSVTAHKVMGG